MVERRSPEFALQWLCDSGQGSLHEGCCSVSLEERERERERERDGESVTSFRSCSIHLLAVSTVSLV